MSKEHDNTDLEKIIYEALSMSYFKGSPKISGPYEDLLKISDRFQNSLNELLKQLESTLNEDDKCKVCYTLAKIYHNIGEKEKVYYYAKKSLPKSKELLKNFLLKNQYLKDALYLNTNSNDIILTLLEYGESILEKKKFNTALKYFTELIKLEKDILDAYWCIGYICAFSKYSKEPLDNFEIDNQKQQKVKPEIKIARKYLNIAIDLKRENPNLIVKMDKDIRNQIFRIVYKLKPNYLYRESQNKIWLEVSYHESLPKPERCKIKRGKDYEEMDFKEIILNNHSEIIEFLIEFETDIKWTFDFRIIEKQDNFLLLKPFEKTQKDSQIQENSRKKERLNYTSYLALKLEMNDKILTSDKKTYLVEFHQNDTLIRNFNKFTRAKKDIRNMPNLYNIVETNKGEVATIYGKYENKFDLLLEKMKIENFCKKTVLEYLLQIAEFIHCCHEHKIVIRSLWKDDIYFVS